jgi:hypothetical protein
MRAGSTAADSSSGGEPAGKQPGVARGLLVTPWFAAATAFVIAASALIYSPHPQFAFPDIAIGKVPCTSSDCASHADQQGAGSLAINSGSQMTPKHKSGTHARAAAHHPASTAVSGLTFGYYLLRPPSDSKFEVVVRVTGKRVFKNWKLAFVLRGDDIQFVFGAHWKVSGDRVIATPLTGGAGQHGGGSGDQGRGLADYRYGHGGPLDQAGIFFTVFASGTPAAPTHCSFDGASCTFHELSSSGPDGR